MVRCLLLLLLLGAVVSLSSSLSGAEGACPCPKIYSPVCGTNGKTYANSCLSKCAKVSVSCKGKCPCPAPSKKPCACPKIYKPVCGVNGKTYGNTCLAVKCAKTKVKHPGKCKKRPVPPVVKCGRRCRKQPKKLVCGKTKRGKRQRTFWNACHARCFGVKKPRPGKCPLSKRAKCFRNCRKEKHPGKRKACFDRCRKPGKPKKPRRPCVCPRIYKPVCGKNNKTYANTCIAVKCAKTKVKHPGKCKRKPTPKKPLSNRAKCVKRCHRKPKKFVCGKSRLTRGRNRTFRNRCHARCYAVTKPRPGKCPLSRRAKCFRNCRKEKHAGKRKACFARCRKMGRPGKPKKPSPPKKPKNCGCPKISRPVCGRNRKSYGNACLAKCAGAKIKHRGPCRRKPKPSPKRPGLKKCRHCSKKPAKPVCGKNGRTFRNACFARCRKVPIVKFGRCPRPKKPKKPRVCSCPKYVRPVCGKNGKTYKNACLARKCAKVAIKHKGPCKKKAGKPKRPAPTPSKRIRALRKALKACQKALRGKRQGKKGPSTPPQRQLRACLKKCSKKKAPVCSVSGRTYRNRCGAKCHKDRVRRPGRCPGPKKGKGKQRPGEQKRKACRRKCPKAKLYVCGANGKTYWNPCQANCSTHRIKCKSPCPCTKA